jgi:uncharacterized protein YecT (DUF1311 family)
MNAAILILLVLSVSSFAQEETCDGTTADMSACLSRILKNTDTHLNSTYQKALATATRDFTAQDVQNLKVAERRWIAYRDAACDAEYGLWGKGTGGLGAHTACLIRISKQRITDLREAYHLEATK